jgi:hypothetical protein
MFVRLRMLTEAECYARCYGAPKEAVKVVRIERRKRGLSSVSGEALRLEFEQRLAGREPAAA